MRRGSGRDEPVALVLGAGGARGFAQIGEFIAIGRAEADRALDAAGY
ncbi:MAG TPA: hypothetical protein VFS82_10075 [Lysobacter sp.]|nr:hypothetical protein [Lysobacter sp.]